MDRQLDELRGLAVNIPVLCGGDVLHTWREPPELVNFAIRSLPAMYAVAGQHDCPNHRWQDIRRSAWWTLVEAGRIIPLEPGKPVCVDGMRLHGFCWGFSPKGLADPHDLVLEVCIWHRYLWTRRTGYHGAGEKDRLAAHQEKLEGYDVALIGDNHTPFHCVLGNGCRVWNAGGFFRRNADQMDHKPSVGLLHSDGTITRHYLDCSKDKFIELGALKALAGSPVLGDLSGFLDEVAGLQGAVADFREAVERFMDQERVPQAVRTAVLQAMEERK